MNQDGQLGLGNNETCIESPLKIPSLSSIKVTPFKTTIYEFIGEWTTKNHKLFPKQTRQEIETILLLSQFKSSGSTPKHPNSMLYTLPKEIKFEVIKFIATYQTRLR